MLESRMEVWANDPAGVVLWAGGLISDRVLAGWDVAVLLPTPLDHRALGILGAKVQRHGKQSAPLDLSTPLVMVNISAGAEDSDQEGRTLSYIGDPGEPETPRTPLADNGFRHRLSVGARAFKAQALRASGLPAEVATTEYFRAATPVPLSIVRGRIDRWPNAGRCNDASNTPGTCC